MFRSILIFPLILICSEMAIFLATDMYLPALPTIMQNLGISAELVQLTLSSWFLGSMSVQLFVGPLSDHYGRRPIFLVGMLIFSLSTLACALAPNLNTLILARFLQGTTISFIIVPGYASIHELYEQKDAVRILAIMSSITILAPALGPFLGGLITSYISWRWIFLSLFIVGTLITGWLIACMPETLKAGKAAPLNLFSTVRHYKSIITNWHFMSHILTYCFIFCGFMSWLICGPFLTIEEFHYSPVFFGLFQLLVFSFYMLANRLVNSLIEKIELPQLIGSGLVILFTGGLFAVLTAWFYPHYLSGLLIGMMLFSFGFGLSSASLQRLAIEASEAPMGSRMAVLSTCIGLSGLLATALVGLNYQGKLSSLASILLATSSLSCLFYLSGKRYRSDTVKELGTLSHP